MTTHHTREDQRTRSPLSRLGLAQRTALLTGLMVLLAGLALVTVANLSSDYIVEQQALEQGSRMAQSLADGAAKDLGTGDLLSLSDRAQGAVRDGVISRIRILDAEGREMATAGDGTPGAPWIRAAISLEQNIAGEIVLQLAPSGAEQDARRSQLGLLFLCLLLAVFAAALGGFHGQRQALRLAALHDALQGDSEPGDEDSDELSRLERRVADLPLELLRGGSGRADAGFDAEPAGLLFLELGGLGHYADTVDESSLLRFARLQQALLESLAQLYGGEMQIIRPFGVLISFSAQHSSGGPAFRAASAAWLAQRVAPAMQQQSRLNLGLKMALGHSEAGAGRSGELYSDLYLQQSVDDLQEICAETGDAIPLSEEAAADPEIQQRCQLERLGHRSVLAGFEQPYADLLARQAELLVRQLQH